MGALYLVGTPIGNLEDMTFRAVRILQTVDLIAAEDTRHTGKLLQHFEIKTPQVSYHEHNRIERIPELLSVLGEGKSIALVTDAGMPGISDPGYELVKACIEAGIQVLEHHDGHDHAVRLGADRRRRRSGRPPVHRRHRQQPRPRRARARPP